MPEAPDLQVVKEFLAQRLTGVAVTEARVLRPTVLRVLAAPQPDFPADVAGRRFDGFWRRGKFLGLELSDDRQLVIAPMLSGALQYCLPSQRVARTTYLALSLTDGHELRYLDADQMGKVYYLRCDQLPEVPRLHEQGPDVLDQPLSLEEFRLRLKPFRGEIKGVLGRGAVVGGLGNAYADEVLYTAGLYPFRRVRDLTPEEMERLHGALYSVPQMAVGVLRERMGDALHHKVRNFLSVHGRGGEPCPRCGGRITAITANGWLTNYCRRCQPGSFFTGRGRRV